MIHLILRGNWEFSPPVSRCLPSRQVAQMNSAINAVIFTSCTVLPLIITRMVGIATYYLSYLQDETA